MAEVDTVKKLRKQLCEELNGMSASLGNLFSTQSVLESFARELFASKIITSNVNNNPNFEDIRREFENTMDFMDSVKEIEGHCIAFIQALGQTGGEGGSTSIAANKLEDQWVTVVYDKLGIVFIRKSSHETTDQSNDQYTSQLHLNSHHEYRTSNFHLRHRLQNNHTLLIEVLDVISAQLKQSPSPTSTDTRTLSDILAQQESNVKQSAKQKHQNNEGLNYTVEPSQTSQQNDHDASERAWTNTHSNHKAPYTDLGINFAAERPSYDEYSTRSSGDIGGNHGISQPMSQSQSSLPHSCASSRKTSTTAPSKKKSFSMDKLKMPPPPSSPEHQPDDHLTPRPGDFTDGDIYTKPVFVEPQQSQIAEEDSDVNDSEMVGTGGKPAALTNTKKGDMHRTVSLNLSEGQQWKEEIDALKLADDTLSKQIESLCCDLQEVQRCVAAALEKKDDLAAEKDSICELKASLKKRKKEKSHAKDAEIAQLKKQQKKENDYKVYEYRVIMITFVLFVMFIFILFVYK